MTDIYGQDIKIDEAMQAVIAANGEAVLTQGAETGCQDIKLRLFQYLGTLFYDKEHGSKLYDWIHEENTGANRIGLVNEVARRVRMDQRVAYGTVSGEVVSWDERGIQVSVSWQFIDADHLFNLVVEMNSNKNEMVIKDVNPY
jgi:hypothetical protein